MSINTERLAFALRETKWTNGDSFEQFSNAFLGSEFPNLQPVGGMHDGGADGILYCADGVPTTFVQSSVTPNFTDKIRKTVKRLADAGRSCRELIYCSPASIIKDIEVITKELRSIGISLLPRDATYFLAYCNSDNARIAASERYFQIVGAPILVTAQLADAQQIQLSSNEEKLLITFFGATLAGADPEGAILKTCYETVVTYCLRDTSSANCLSKQQILAASRAMARHESDAIFQQRVEGALTKLVHRGTVKLRQDLNAYQLAHSEKERTEIGLLSLHRRMTEALREMEAYIKDIKTRLGATQIPDEDECGRILLRVINSVLCAQSDIATRALTESRFSIVDQRSLRDIVISHLKPPSNIATTVEFFIILTESIFSRPPPTIATYFRSVADAYFLFFLLQQPADIQDALRKIIGKANIVLDASVVIPCLAEYAYGQDQRTRQNLLKAVVNAGGYLSMSDRGVSEVVAHFGKARAIYERISQGQPHYGNSAFVDAYYSSDNSKFKSFHEFLGYFSSGDSEQDMQELLRNEFGVKIFSLPDLTETSINRVQSLTAAWVALRQKPPELDDDDFAALVQNDVRTYLYIKNTRTQQKSHEKIYGEVWWWLTEDNTAHSIDRSDTPNGTINACMRPDFLLRYVSVMPRARAINEANQLAPLPISIDMAGLGLIPDSIAAANAKSAEIVEDDPPFRRQMKLRAYINRVRSIK